MDVLLEIVCAQRILTMFFDAKENAINSMAIDDTLLCLSFNNLHTQRERDGDTSKS